MTRLRSTGLAIAIAGFVVLALGPRQAPPAAPPVLALNDELVGASAGGAPRIAPGRLVVKFRAVAAADAIERAVADEALEPLGALPAAGARVVRVPEGQEHEAAARLRANPAVEYAEPDYVARRAAPVPADPFYAAAQLDLPRVGMDVAWDVTFGSASVMVAVLDQGISAAHPDLIGQWTYAAGAPAGGHVILSSPLSDGCTVPATPEDDGWQDTGSNSPFTHGAHVAGTIAANSTLVGGPAVGIAGMAPGVRVLPIKVLDCQGSGYFSDIAAGIGFAASHGARVVNLSLSGAVPSGCPPYLQNAIDAATAVGTLVVAAVGNSGTSAVEYPAGCANVLGVGATTNADAATSFTQRNGSVDLVAPGVTITSTVRTTAGAYSYATSSGTSMAAPHVAACAALIYSARPGITPAIVLGHLLATAADLGTPGRDDTYGWGRLNCGAAVQRAIGITAATPSPTPTLVDKNCTDFATWSEAQAYFIAQGGPALDPSGLDSNHNGIACESLPGAPGNTATATALAQLMPTTTRSPTVTTGPPASPTATSVQPGSPTTTPTPTLSPTVTATPTNTVPPAPTPTVPPGGERFEDNSSAITYSAGWTQVLDPGSSAGHHRRSSQPGATASFTFTGAGGSVVWATMRGPTGGRADVALDGVFLGTVDLYAPQVEHGYVTSFAAPPNRHTLRVTVRGDANPAASGADVSVDFFDVVDVVGGRGFAIRREVSGVLEGVVASWQPGTAQTGYYLARMSAGGTTLLPVGGTVLPRSATTFSDFSLFADGMYCYLLLPVEGVPAVAIGNSDLLCGMRGTRTGAAPWGLSLRLDQSTRATLDWMPPATPPGAVPSFAVVVLGSDAQVMLVPPGQFQATHETGGTARCYAVVTIAGDATVGVSDVVCAVPGVARL